MAKRPRKPQKSETMYFVQEHLYYIESRVAPVFEYVVCSGKVTGFFRGGYIEVCLTGKSPEGYTTPYRYKLSEVGKKIFYSPKEAAELAMKMTDAYDKTWSWMEEPLRRTWEVYLQE